MSRCGGYGRLPFVADLYDHVRMYANRRDVGFYVNLCRARGGTVLELGCGTGRLLVPLASAGLKIVGLDLSRPMLAKCREKLSGQPKAIRSRIRLVRASMTRFRLGQTFNTIIIPFRPFQHLLSVKDQLACLRCVREHLKPGGRLAFDCFQVHAFRKITDPCRTRETEDHAAFSLPDGRRMRRCYRVAATHPAQQYDEIELIYYVTDKTGRTRRLVHRFPFRYFYRYEVEHLLARAGFELTHLYGDFDRSPLRDQSPELVFVARRTRG